MEIKIDLTPDSRQDFINYLTKIDGSINSYSTIESYMTSINNIWKNYKELTPETSKQMLIRWNKNTKIRAVLNKLNQFFDYNNIDYLIKIPRSKRAPKKLPDILGREELRDLIKDIPKQARLIIECIFNIGAGLRISEVINLNWEDIDWRNWSQENKIIDVKIRNSKRGKDRIVPIPSFTAAELYEYAKDIDKINEDGYPYGGTIFDLGSKTFKQELKILDEKLWKYEYTRHAYHFIKYNLINRYFRKLTGRHITAHSLRHARASELYKLGVPITKIQQWLGHTDISTTMIYVHLGSSEDKKIMEEVGGV